ncbi:MAG: CcmD family protein [Flavobacteriales bacterium]
MQKLILVSLFLWSIAAQAQGLENSLYSNGKINIVVGVVVIIFSGIIFYLIRMERKIKRLEKKVKND